MIYIISTILTIIMFIAIGYTLVGLQKYKKVAKKILRLAREIGTPALGRTFQIEKLRGIARSIDSTESRELLSELESAAQIYVIRFRLALAVIIPLVILLFVLKLEF